MLWVLQKYGNSLTGREEEEVEERGPLDVGEKDMPSEARGRRRAHLILNVGERESRQNFPWRE